MYYFIKRISFKEVISVKIIEYTDNAFEFIIVTKTFTKKLPYARYLKKRPNEKIKFILNELKQDLLNIQNNKK